MALVKDLEVSKSKPGSVHSPVQAECFQFKSDGQTYLQINTFGSPTRKIVGKTSQAIQFGPGALKQLKAIIDGMKELEV